MGSKSAGSEQTNEIDCTATPTIPAHGSATFDVTGGADDMPPGHYTVFFAIAGGNRVRVTTQIR